jgi:hypothetical protein
MIDPRPSGKTANVNRPLGSTTDESFVGIDTVVHGIKNLLLTILWASEAMRNELSEKHGSYEKAVTIGHAAKECDRLIGLLVSNNRGINNHKEADAGSGRSRSTL